MIFSSFFFNNTADLTVKSRGDPPIYHRERLACSRKVERLMMDTAPQVQYSSCLKAVCVQNIYEIYIYNERQAFSWVPDWCCASERKVRNRNSGASSSSSSAVPHWPVDRCAAQDELLTFPRRFFSPSPLTRSAPTWKLLPSERAPPVFGLSILLKNQMNVWGFRVRLYKRMETEWKSAWSPWKARDPNVCVCVFCLKKALWQPEVFNQHTFFLKWELVLTFIIFNPGWKLKSGGLSSGFGCTKEWKLNGTSMWSPRKDRDPNVCVCSS